MKIVIVTPLLTCDRFSDELSAGLDRLGLPFSHVVVAPEKTLAKLRGFSSSHRVIEREGTRGVFDAVMQGVAYANANLSPDAFIYINADDVLYPALKEMFSAHQLNPEAIIVGRSEWIDEEGRSNGTIPCWNTRYYSDLLFEVNIQPITQQSILVPMTVVNTFGGLDLKYKYIADTVFWHKLFRDSSVSFVYIPEVVAGYRMRKGQLSSNRNLVDQETVAWRKAVGARSPLSLLAILIRVSFRLRNFGVYLRRFLRSKTMRSTQAMSKGGF